MSLTQQDFRDAMARLGAAVNIITTDGPGGRAGFTASAVCSVTDDPPTLLVCMNRGASSAPALRANGVLCVNSVAAAQKDIAAVFAGATRCPPAERFLAGSWDRLATGSPVLQGAVVSFDCRINETIEKGTHIVIFAAIEQVRQGRATDPALIYYGRDYHPVGHAAGAEA